MLFARNVRDPEQLAGADGALRAARPETVVAIDEEGGDVTRLEADARELRIPATSRSARSTTSS